MLTKLARYADKYSMLPQRGGTVLAAVSGGADSVCLLRALIALSETHGFRVACAHFNHRLRGDESDRDEAFVRTLCQKLGVPFYCGGADVRAAAAVKKAGIEETARALRYDFLSETARKCGADVIATAHTADDNTETVILNLVRGAGLRGLTGIPPVRDNIIRPMLCLTREDVLEYLKECNQDYVEDSTNAVTVYTRNRLRHRVIPLLREMNPRLHSTVLTTSRLLREDDAYLSELARALFTENCPEGQIPCEKLSGLPYSLSSRVIRLAADTALSAEQTDAVLALCEKKAASSELSVPGMTAIVEYGVLRFERDDGLSPKTFQPVSLTPGQSAVIPELGLRVTLRKTVSPEKIHKTFNNFLFNFDSVYGIIVIRPRRTGDKISLFGRNGTKSLKRLFIEEKIPKRSRALVPVVADEKGVLAVCGIGQDIRAFPVSARPALEIIFEEISYAP
ncbi:MAG TPA: tRNA lysidine(34) synthetase TilS [Papillibacter sp.]|jgi:tRNA(Ile)-lysidine synthase|nr:tRNA lysidine(34) synthetase TilS [Papillibacter sp.]